MGRGGTRALLAAAAALLAAAAGQAHAGAPVAARLGHSGDRAFWGAGQAAKSGGGHYEFALEVGRASAKDRLRVAFDHPDYREYFQVTLRGPGDVSIGFNTVYDSSEVFLNAPAAGAWRVVVDGPETSKDFQLRAALERIPAKPAKPRRLLPNLRLVPPYELSLYAPLSGGRGSLYVAGPSGVASCTADDVAEHQAVRCLRFSTGPANVGEGPLELSFPGGQGLVTPGPVTQRVYWTDGHSDTRPAGTFEYHKTHQHYHHSGFGSLELLRADPASRTLTHLSNGPKQGFCTGDVMISEWRRFANAPQFSARSDCLADAGGVYDPTAGTEMGLSPGWTDLYSWEQDGNYVDLPLDAGDGRYVVRSTADALGNILESDESDNTGYTYFQVTGADIRVLERGHGSGPWDPRKELVHDGLHTLA